ncbi:unnamed protein product [Protopolystoma xenopodis]|uniref:Uncharacterized protein n=1 Tax=Protopolystoma xenopodis TaxID=117903 RepID=A0A448XLQ2_9PLAT|nr:unnamed protein product [Protopolystoma xenopodis]
MADKEEKIAADGQSPSADGSASMTTAGGRPVDSQSLQEANLAPTTWSTRDKKQPSPHRSSGLEDGTGRQLRRSGSLRLGQPSGLVEEEIHPTVARAALRLIGAQEGTTEPQLVLWREFQCSGLSEPTRG